MLTEENNLPSVYGDFQIDEYLSLIKKLKKSPKIIKKTENLKKHKKFSQIVKNLMTE